MRLVPKRLRWMGLGALAAWLFDPERGQARRDHIADRASEVMRKTGLSDGRKPDTHVPDTSAPQAPASASTYTGTYTS